jgi:predicted transcriptional regulator of viral defense system
MKAVMQYLSVLLMYIQKRADGERGGIVSIKTRAVCGEDRRCVRAVNSLMMSLAERGLVKCHKRGVYLIEKRAVEEVVKALKEQRNMAVLSSQLGSRRVSAKGLSTSRGSTA